MSLWLNQPVLHRIITWEAQKTSQKFSFIFLKILFLGKILGGIYATTTLGDVVLPASLACSEPWSIPLNCALSKPTADMAFTNVCQYRMCDFWIAHKPGVPQQTKLTSALDVGFCQGCGQEKELPLKVPLGALQSSWCVCWSIFVKAAGGVFPVQTAPVSHRNVCRTGEFLCILVP